MKIQTITRHRVRALLIATALALGTVGGTIGFGFAGVADAATTSTINAGTQLHSGQGLDSGSGQFHLGMQSDGNLVLTSQPDNRVLWNTKTGGNPGAYFAFQTDGNLVVYSSAQKVLWTTRTSSSKGGTLSLQNDGNLVARSGGGSLLYATYTSLATLRPGDHLQPGYALRNNGFVLSMQSDGNLVDSNSSGTAIWSTQTGGHPGAYATFQTDGNFVVYSADGSTPLFAKVVNATNGSFGIDSTGIVYIANSAGHNVWQDKYATPPTGGNNEQTAFNFFVGQNFSEQQSAGIVGNLIQESNVSPTSVEANGVGHGIAQWSEPGRWDTLQSWASAQGLSPTDLTTQLKFIMYEFPSYGESDLKATTNITDATTSFMNHYELCGDCVVTNRISYAQEVYADYGSEAP
jgi:hypothetical protein